MKNGVIVLIVVLGIILVGAFWLGGTYNSVIALEEDVDAKWAQIENQLQRRYDLVPDLVKIANKYASHEKDTIEAVVNARAKLNGVNTVEEEVNASKELEGAISRLLVVVENYPTLKADATYISLMDEMSGTENRIAVARKDYNESVREYNVKIKSFPTVLIRGMIGAEEKTFFEVDSNVMAKPEYEL